MKKTLMFGLVAAMAFTSVWLLGGAVNGGREPLALAGTPPTTVSDELGQLRDAWQRRGITVLEATIDPGEAGTLVVKVPMEQMLPGRDVFTTHGLLKEAVLARSRGMAIEWLTALAVDEAGMEDEYLGVALAGLMPDDKWQATPGLAEDALQTSATGAVSAAAEEAGITSATVGIVSEDSSRGLDVGGVLSEGGARDVSGFVSRIHSKVLEWNKEQGALIGVLTFRITDPRGELLLAEVDDFQIGNGRRTVWARPGFAPSWLQ